MPLLGLNLLEWQAKILSTYAFPNHCDHVLLIFPTLKLTESVWEYQTTWPASWEICIQVRKQQLELDMEQQTAFILGKEYVKALYCHAAYLIYMQSTSWETWAGSSTGWNQDCQEKYQ